MKMERDQVTVGDLLELHNNGMLRASPEYQRGGVWSENQKKKFIDSVLRGYPIPLIYLHHIRKEVAGIQREDLEIVDGQQRLTALHEFSKGAFKLLDPIKDQGKDRKFPRFLQNAPCPWAEKDFDTLDEELRVRLLETELSVVRITTENENEVRDLFIRLQAGLPLNRQETRDAWPGDFTDFILRLGGKPELTRYPGHDFFRDVMGRSTRSPRAACSGTCTTSWTGSSPTRTAGLGPWRPRRSSPAWSRSTTSGSRGVVRWLRPEYQVPRFRDMVEAGDGATQELAMADTEADDLPEWPQDAIEQLTALRASVAVRPGTVEAIGRRFQGRGERRWRRTWKC